MRKVTILNIDIDEPLTNSLIRDFMVKAKRVAGILGLEFRNISFYVSSKSCLTHISINAVYNRTGRFKGKKLSSKDTIIVQGALGDDHIRMTYNLRRALRNQKNWNILGKHTFVYGFSKMPTWDEIGEMGKFDYVHLF